MILNMEQMAKEVAQRVLDEAMYEGKTLREWIEIVKSRPPVVHARWIQEDEDAWSCTGCGVFWTFLDGGPAENEANYCPVCGARMDGDPHDSGQ